MNRLVAKIVVPTLFVLFTGATYMLNSKEKDKEILKPKPKVRELDSNESDNPYKDVDQTMRMR